MAGLDKFQVTVGKDSPSGLSRADGKGGRQIKREKDGSFELHADDVASFRKAGFKVTPWVERTGGATEIKDHKKTDKKPE